MTESQLRLEQFLTSRGQSTSFHVLLADASTREYFRITWDLNSAVACVYPEPFDPSQQSFLDVTRLFLASGLPVADVMDFDGPLGIIIQEDLGDQIVRDVLTDADDTKRSDLINEAITLIARIQGATENAFKMGSISSRLRFDTEKLLWELEYFREHYFGTMLNKPLTDAENDALTNEFKQLSTELELRASVLTHRDFHPANLMIDRYGRMRIIDHQDARIGSAAYDLVSLLLDRITELPSTEWIAEKQQYLLAGRERLGLAEIEPAEFSYEFDLQTIQRCLKAAGTFSYQSAVRGKTHFVPFIKPMFRAVLRAVDSLDQFPALKMILGEQLDQKEDH
jgi:aminoglycoside/choline kinase family phosphotransferase